MGGPHEGRQVKDLVLGPAEHIRPEIFPDRIDALFRHLFGLVGELVHVIETFRVCRKRSKIRQPLSDEVTEPSERRRTKEVEQVVQLAQVVVERGS